MDVHWHATADGEVIAAESGAAAAAAVGFAMWEDARECLLFAVVDRLVTVATTETGDFRRQALLRIAAGLETARSGWRWSCDSADGHWSLLVCTDENCACEVLAGPVDAWTHPAAAG